MQSREISIITLDKLDFYIITTNYAVIKLNINLEKLYIYFCVIKWGWSFINCDLYSYSTGFVPVYCDLL